MADGLFGEVADEPSLAAESVHWNGVLLCVVADAAVSLLEVLFEGNRFQRTRGRRLLRHQNAGVHRSVFKHWKAAKV